MLQSSMGSNVPLTLNFAGDNVSEAVDRLTWLNNAAFRMFPMRHGPGVFFSFSGLNCENMVVVVAFTESEVTRMALVNSIGTNVNREFTGHLAECVRVPLFPS